MKGSTDMEANTEMKLPDLLKAREVAQRFDVTVARLYEMVRLQDIPPGVVVWLGPRGLRFRPDALDQWLEKGGLKRSGRRAQRAQRAAS